MSSVGEYPYHYTLYHKDVSFSVMSDDAVYGVLCRDFLEFGCSAWFEVEKGLSVGEGVACLAAVVAH